MGREITNRDAYSKAIIDQQKELIALSIKEREMLIEDRNVMIETIKQNNQLMGTAIQAIENLTKTLIAQKNKI